MPKEIMEKIFDPYFTTKRQGEGTGMGLAIVHGIVKSYNGKITVYSEPGKGTTFHVYLPSEKGTVPLPETSEHAALPRGREQILLVDDEDAIVTMEVLLLTALGYQVEGVTDSGAALARFTSQPDRYDLLITDMTMPGMSGVELAQRIWEVRPETPVIMCTGFSETINADRAKALGISQYLMKPVSHGEFAVAVRDALDGKR